MAFFRGQYEQMMLGSCPPGLILDAAGKALLAFGEQGVPHNPITDALSSCMAQLQEADGGWDHDGLQLRPPLNPTAISSAALAIYAMQDYSPPATEKETDERTVRGLAYLRAATPADTQDEVFKLLGFVWAGAPDEEASRMSNRVLSLQRGDGGWGQLPTMNADPFATAESLYALHAAGLSARSAAYLRGVQSLSRTQLSDGSWTVRSRAFGFQPYHEYGFPHGRDQFISAAATSWAVIALAYTL